MLFARYTVLLFILVYFPNTGAICQDKNAQSGQFVDLFKDLPIDDPLSRSYLEPGESAEEKIRKSIFVRAFFNKPVCYAGEPVLLTFELLSSLQSTSTIQRYPSFEGFQISDLDPDNDFPKYRKQGGIKYSVFTLKQSQLIPFETGDIKIGEIVVNNEVNYKKDNRNYSYSGVIYSKPVNIHVQPLPETGKPASFTGAVGNFKVDASVRADTFSAGENNLLQIKISGSGNFPSVLVPSFSLPAGFQDFAFSEKSAVNERIFPVKGDKTFSIPFTAAQAGNFIIPSIELSFFDPSAKKYRSSTANAINVVVTAAIIDTADGKRTESSDLRKESPDRSRMYWVAGILLVVLITGYVRQRLLAKKAALAAEKIRLNEIQNAIDEKANRFNRAMANLEAQESTSDYIVELKQVLIDFLHEKSGKPDAFADEMIPLVHAKDSETAEELVKLINKCDMLLYAPVFLDTETRKKLLVRLRSIIEKIDRLSL